MIYITIIIVVVILALLFIVFKNSDLSRQMNKLADEAVTDAKINHSYSLDMTEASLESVNLILQKLHNKNTNDVKKLAMMYGAYIGKIVINLYNDGVWLKNHPSIGRNTYPIKFSNGHYALPIMWARDHLSNGEDNNILYRFISLKHSHEG